MARGIVLLRFEDELFDLFSIKSIRRYETFDTDTCEMEYGIIINEEVHSDAPFRDVKFKYKTEEVRETKLKDIEHKLLGFEYVIIL